MFNDEVLNSISDIFKNYEAYLVGGYLRNYYINNEISLDRDIVVNSNAMNLAKEIATRLDATFIELDSENKIYRVVLKDKINFLDISEALENDILKDAHRRDFTINSVFYDLNNKKIFDPLNGIDDIKNKIIKTYNYKNMNDDPLRFLRLYRFVSLTGFDVDIELRKYVKENFDLIKSVAMERVNYEIIKIFEGKYVVQTLLMMLEDNVLEKVFPFVSEIKRIPPNSHHHLDLIHHSIETVNNIRINNPLLKISAFYHDIGKPSTWTIEENGRHRFIGHDVKGALIAKKELEKLKFSNKQVSYICKMIKNHIYPATLINCVDNNKAFARFVRRMDIDTPDIIELSRADRLSAQGVDITKEIVEKSLEHLDNLLKYYNSVKDLVKEPKSLVDGKEIMQILNIEPSKMVGDILEELKELQLASIIKTKEEAIAYIKNKAVKANFNGTKN